MAQLISLRDQHPVFNILFASFIAFLSALTFYLLAVLIIWLGWGIEPTALGDFENPALLNPLKFIQAMSSIGLFIVPCFVLLKIGGEDSAAFLKMKALPALTSLILVFFIMIMVQPLVEVTAKWNAAFPFPEGIAQWIRESEEQAEILTKLFLKADTVGVFLLNVFIMAFLPALGEELFFRGIIQTYIIKAVKNIYIGVIITAILFSAFHFQFMGFLPRMLLGIILGLIFVWSGNIWLSVFAHFLNNGAAVTLDYLTQRGVIDQEQLETASSDGVLIPLFSLVLLGMLLFALKRQGYGAKAPDKVAF